MTVYTTWREIDGIPHAIVHDGPVITHAFNLSDSYMPRQVLPEGIVAKIPTGTSFTPSEEQTNALDEVMGACIPG